MRNYFCQKYEMKVSSLRFQVTLCWTSWELQLRAWQWGGAVTENNSWSFHLCVWWPVTETNWDTSEQWGLHSYSQIRLSHSSASGEKIKHKLAAESKSVVIKDGNISRVTVLLVQSLRDAVRSFLFPTFTLFVFCFRLMQNSDRTIQSLQANEANIASFNCID